MRLFFIIRVLLILAPRGSNLIEPFHQPSKLQKPYRLKLDGTSRDEILGYLFYGDEYKANPKRSFMDLNFIASSDYVTENGKRKNILFLSKDSLRVGNDNVYEAIPVILSDSISKECLRLVVPTEIRDSSLMIGASRLSTCLVNRDNALFDNLPWAEWTVDPQSLYKDSMGQAVVSKYHMGKRIAYNRLMGGDHNTYGNDFFRNESLSFIPLTRLQDKVLELEVKEARMKVADTEQTLAISRTVKKNTQDVDNMATINNNIETASRNLQDAQLRLSSLEGELQSRIRWAQFVTISTQFVNKFLSFLPLFTEKAIRSFDNERDASSPYLLLQKIILEQLNADIIACVLENTCLFRGNVQLGGAIVLSRRGRSKNIRIDGKTLSFEDSDDDFGNKGISRGDILIIDCDVDEAIGMAKSCEISLLVDSEIWDDLKIRVSVTEMDKKGTQIQVLDPTLKWFISEKSKVSPDISATPSSVDSLERYDLLTNEDKAHLLIANSVQLPRLRLVQESQRRNLDDLLLPFLDEAVRRSFLIREASKAGDTKEVERLRREMSERQRLVEQSRRARLEGDLKEADELHEMVMQLDMLRADTTQDEGAYSRKC